MSYETIDCSLTDGVLLLQLNRPDLLNAFTVQMANELEAEFNRASEDSEVRVVVVTGAGRAFCAGMDLSTGGNVFGLDESLQPTMKDMRTRLEDPEMIDGVRDTGGRVTLAIYNCNKPVIGAINGVAVGIGATMTLAMDMRLVSNKARFGFVFSKIGVTPEACSTWFLPRIVGMQQALEWMYTGEIFDAEEALRGGLARSLHEPDELLDAAMQLAAKIARSTSAVSVALTRQMLYRNSAARGPLEAHQVDSLAMFYSSLGDGKEGVQAFLDKRAPEFASRVPEDLPPFFPWWRNQAP